MPNGLDESNEVTETPFGCMLPEDKGKDDDCGDDEYDAATVEEGYGAAADRVENGVAPKAPPTKRTEPGHGFMD